ncbi:MAG TPA: Na+/H+ antiporter NhaA [Burkholderiales bacterium]|jgi:NhaA family Na+:H+ antiporter|nr:Na+/H+ antiporter NhaA [Burkholderiales bacterium]
MFRRFFALESASGFILFGAALLAVALSNSALGPGFLHALHQPFAAALGPLGVNTSIELAVNDGLMVVFFLLVGLEIKREILAGELSERSKIALPAVAAIGGMAAPALLYAACNWGNAAALRGWAIPAATDIAFSLGVLTLLGRRVPLSLKVFLTALAIIDDLGAIVVIALFYTDHLSLPMLAGAALTGAALYGANRGGVTALRVYLLLGALLWFFVLKSGVHATLAGVALAFAIPLRIKDAGGHAPLLRLEHALHPWVAFGVLPVFALVNAGVSFDGMSLSTLLLPIPLGITIGLVAGKACGIFGCCWVLLKLTRAPLPAGASWPALFGVALLGGIGFTMSLFIGNLAFAGDAGFAAELRLGVIAGSLISALAGYLVLRGAAPAPT